MVVPKPGRVTWTIHRGLKVVWRQTSDAQKVGLTRLPTKDLERALYKLDARIGDEYRSINLLMKCDELSSPAQPLISFNANLAPSSRYAAIGHQWLLLGPVSEAMMSLKASLDRGSTTSAQIEMARAEALARDLDKARARARSVLADSRGTLRRFLCWLISKQSFRITPLQMTCTGVLWRFRTLRLSGLPWRRPSQ